MKPQPFLIAVVFFCLWTYLGFNLALTNSPTFDEPVHAKAGQLYQQGNFDFDPIEPPLIRRFVTTASNFTGLLARNIITLSTGLLASGLVYYLSCVSLFAGWLSSFLFLTQPNLVAHSALFTTDAIAAFLTAISVLLILKNFWQRSWQLAILSLFVGLSASSKVSSLSLLGPLLLLKFSKLGFLRLFTIVLVSCFLVWSTYDFRLELPFKHFLFPIPLGGYLRSLKENFQFAQRGQPIFFFEHLFTTGPWYKQPVVFLLKTPLLHLALFGLTGQYLLPLLLILIVNSSVGLHFGIRHLLVASILVLLSAAQINLRRPILKIFLLLLVMIQAVSVYSFLPQLLTYTNPLAGRQPYRIFTDSDFDWGQGLFSLKSAIRQQGIANYQLAYFGNANPATYLGKFIRIKDSNPIGNQSVMAYDPQLPAIISITCYYQCGYYLNPRFPLSRAELTAQSFLLFKTHD
jgi:hypothetical protein